MRAGRIAKTLTAVGFVALGAAIAWEWYRYRGEAQGRLALSLVFLAVVAALGRVQELLGLSGVASTLIGLVTIIAFEASGYFVLMFRDAFLPLSPRARWAARVFLAVTCVIGLADVTLLSNAGRDVATAAAFELIFAWVASTGDHIVRSWLASRNLPHSHKTPTR